LGTHDHCRKIFERYVDCHPETKTYLRAAKFEEGIKERERSRLFYERGLAELGEKALDEDFFINFTRFEIKSKEFDRARVLFKYALDQMPKPKASKLYFHFIKFEKQFGKKDEMEEIIL